MPMKKVGVAGLPVEGAVDGLPVERVREASLNGLLLHGAEKFRKESTAGFRRAAVDA